MPKKFKGENSKVAAANEKKSKVNAEKKKKQDMETEQQMAKEWKKGADARGTSKRMEEEEKRRIADEKAMEKKKLLALDEAMVSSVKVAKSATKKTKDQKAKDKPWEAALAPVAKKKGKSRRQVMMTQEQTEEEVDVFDGLAPTIDIGKNRNRDASANTEGTFAILC